MQQLDVPIIHKSYELYHALHEIQRSVPKIERYTLWQRCENTALQILEDFIRMGYLPQEERPQRLTDVSVLIDMLRIFIRLSYEVKAISQKKYLLLQQKLDEIGRMLGGWLKSIKQSKAPPQSM